MMMQIDPETLTATRLYVSLRQAAALKKAAEQKNISVSALARAILDGWLLSGGGA